MPIDFRNTNSVWASILAETLRRLGLAIAVICPGSRSSPLAIAFASQADIEAVPILDERSAAFFALGAARRLGLPVALVCTSGTAGANFYPAVIEARESQVPLLVLTADRPPELRDCRAGQAIDQLKLFGTYPTWQAELASPSLEPGMLAYLRQTMIHAWERSLWPVAGPVHLNISFHEPLAPIPDAAASTLKPHFEAEDFFAAVYPSVSGGAIGSIADVSQTSTRLPISPFPYQAKPHSTIPLHEWQQCTQGIIIAGPAQPRFPELYCAAIAQISQALGWPVLAEGLSPLRNYADTNPHLVSTYDLIVRNPRLANQLVPERVIRIGEMPTSKDLRNWLDQTQPKQWIVDPGDRNLDPLHGKTIHLRCSVEQLAQLLLSEPAIPSLYLKLWGAAEAQVQQTVDQVMAAISVLFEGKAAWLLSKILPPRTPLFIANSMPVRDVESFWRPGNSQVQPFFNRGANGIDGTLSTALGVAHRNQSSVMLTGDLALLHDTNGFLFRNQFVGHLTIVLINNDGGGIFEMLPIANFEPPFEEFFATPQTVDFGKLCATYNVAHELIHSWEQLAQCLNLLPTEGIRVLELQTDRKADARWRQEHLSKFAIDI